MAAEIFSGKHEPGSAFQFEKQWYIADKNDYISARDVYDADDVNDIQLEVGWNTVAHVAVSEQDLALVAAHQEEEARKQREYYEKWNPINARLAKEAAAKAAIKQEQQRERMRKDYGIGIRVQNRYIAKLVGNVVAHHETEPKVSVQWDGESHPACMGNTTLVTWFGLNDLKILTGSESHARN